MAGLLVLEQKIHTEKLGELKQRESVSFGVVSGNSQLVLPT